MINVKVGMLERWSGAVENGHIRQIRVKLKLTTYELCNLGQVTSFLCSSVLSSDKSGVVTTLHITVRIRENIFKVSS